MTRLTEDTKKRIARNAITHKYQPLAEAMKGEEAALALRCYQAVYPASQLAIVATLPPEWFTRCKCLKFNANGWSVTLCAAEDMPTHSANHCRPLGTVTGELAEQVQDYSQRKKKIQEEERSATYEMEGFLNSFKTIKQLRDAWPEGEAFYAQYDVSRPAGGVPAVRVAAINELLGIKGVAA